MKVSQTNRKSRKTIISIVVSAIVIVAIGSISYALLSNRENNQGIVDQSQSNADVDGTDSKQELVENENEAETPQLDPSIEMSLSQSNQQVAVSTKLYDYSDGNCTLKVTQAGNEYKSTAPIIFQAEFSTCAGFSVPVSELGMGTWNVLMTVESAGKITNKSGTINVK